MMLESKIKKTAALLLVGVLALTGCGKDKASAVEENVANIEQMDVAKYVTLPEYKGIALTETAAIQVSDADVESYLQTVRNNAEAFHLYSGSVKDGDTVNIDYVGTIDGVAFDGGTASGQLLGIGSHSFIDGFEDGLIGASVGDTVDLNLSFPEGYRAADLAGKACVFTVTVNYILDGLTDENVAKLDEGYTSAQAYVEDTKAMMQDYYDYQADSTAKMDIAQYLIDNATFSSIPESLKADFVRLYKDELESEAKDQGMSLEDYMNTYYGIAADQIDATVENWSESLVKEAIILQAIANAEDLNVTAEEVQEQLSKAESEEGTASEVEGMAEGDRKSLVRLNMMRDKVYEFLRANANISYN